MNNDAPRPGPRPGALPGQVSGPNLDEVRLAFDDALAASFSGSISADGGEAVTNEQVEALDRAHAILADVLEQMDGVR